MASELLVVPEDDLEVVIGVIYAGISAREETMPLRTKSGRNQARVHKELIKWCQSEEAYLRRLRE